MYFTTVAIRDSGRGDSVSGPACFCIPARCFTSIAILKPYRGGGGDAGPDAHAHARTVGQRYEWRDGGLAEAKRRRGGLFGGARDGA
jgi:hypothetical protein